MKHVPVMVDKVILINGAKWVRCTFFIIETDTPDGAWDAYRYRTKVPLFLLGIHGILWKPLGRSRIFRDPMQIEELFDWVETHLSLIVELDEIHLPYDLLGAKSLARGQVYRVGETLFQDAWLFRAGKITREELIKRTIRGVSNVDKPPGEKFRLPIRHSIKETEVFRAWQEAVIEGARSQFYALEKDFSLDRVEPKKRTYRKREDSDA